MNSIIAPKLQTPIAPGAHAAVVEDIADLGLQPGFDPVEPPRQQLAVRIGIQNGNGQTRSLWITATASMHPKATLAKIANAAGFTIAAGQEFDPETLVGKAMTVITESEPGRDGKVYAKPTAYTLATPATTITSTARRGDLPEWLARKSANRLDKPAQASVTATVPASKGEASNTTNTNGTARW